MHVKKGKADEKTLRRWRVARAVNIHRGPQRVTARGLWLSFHLAPSAQPGRSLDQLSSHMLAIPTPAKCISLICPQDGGDDEGLYDPD